MRRITLWITATVAALALMFSYQLNAAGATGKAGDDQSTSTSTSTTSTADSTAKTGESK
jgi:hypothetical protein